MGEMNAPQAPSVPDTTAAPEAAPQGAPEQGNSNPQQASKSAGAAKHSGNQSTETFDVKVNGKMVKMTRQELIDNASMSHSATAKFNEAAKTRKEVDAIITKAKSNPIEALMDPALGLTKDQIRDAFEQWYNKEYIEPESLSADERKIKDYEAKLAKYQEDEAKQKEETEREAQEKLTSQQREYLQNQIVEALEKSGLPKNKFFATRIAFYMRQNLANGWEAPLDMIVSQVKNERKSLLGDQVGSSSAEQLIEMLGEDAVRKLREYDLKQLRERRSGRERAPIGVNPNSDNSPQKKITMDEANRNLRKMRMGEL